MSSSKLPIIAALLAAAAYVFTTFHFAHDLPERIATHFNAAGRANGWMTRAGLINFDLAVGLGSQAFVALVCYLVRYLPPASLNVPNRAYWHKPENFPKACEISFRMSLWLGTFITLWLILLNYQVRQANQQVPPHLNNQAFLLTMGAFLVVMAGWTIAMFRLYRVPADASISG